VGIVIISELVANSTSNAIAKVAARLGVLCFRKEFNIIYTPFSSFFSLQNLFCSQDMFDFCIYNSASGVSTDNAKVLNQKRMKYISNGFIHSRKNLEKRREN
jgi:hypothetical protein